MAKIIIEQREMDYPEFVRRYRVCAPRAVAACEKYAEAQFVVFQLDGVPTMVYVKHVTDDNGHRLIMLYNVVYSIPYTEVDLLRRYKDAYEQKSYLVAFDLPRAIEVEGLTSALLRFTRLDDEAVSPVHTLQPFTITQDTLEQQGGMAWLDAIAPGIPDEQELHLVCYSPSIEHKVARHLAEQHGFRNHRCVYIP